MQQLNIINDVTLMAIDCLKSGIQFSTDSFCKSWYRIAPEECNRLSTPDFERKYPRDTKYKNVIRYAIWAARKYELIRHVRHGLWERV